MPNVNVKANTIGSIPEIGVTPYRVAVPNGRANLTWQATGNLNPTFPDTDYFAWITSPAPAPVPTLNDSKTLTLDYDNNAPSLWTYRIRILYDGGPTDGIWIDPEIDNRPPGGFDGDVGQPGQPGQPGGGQPGGGQPGGGQSGGGQPPNF